MTVKHTKRGWAQDQRRQSTQKWEVYYRKKLREKKVAINKEKKKRDKSDKRKKN